MLVILPEAGELRIKIDRDDLVGLHSQQRINRLSGQPNRLESALQIPAAFFASSECPLSWLPQCFVTTTMENLGGPFVAAAYLSIWVTVTNGLIPVLRVEIPS